MNAARWALAVVFLVAATLKGSPYESLVAATLKEAPPEGQLTSGQGPGITPEQVAPFMGTWVDQDDESRRCPGDSADLEKNGIVAASVQLGKFPPSEATGMVRDGDMLVLTTMRRENGIQSGS